MPRWVSSHKENRLWIDLPAPSTPQQRTPCDRGLQRCSSGRTRDRGHQTWRPQFLLRELARQKRATGYRRSINPYDKAMGRMVVTAPSHYQVVSNGLLAEETDLDDSTRLTVWDQSVPIATWLYTLGVARFAVQQLEDFDGKPVQTWVFRQDRDDGFFDFAVPTHDVLDFFSQEVGSYSYEKLANIPKQQRRRRHGVRLRHFLRR